MACADIPMDIRGAEERDGVNETRLLTQYYKATDEESRAKRPLHDFLLREPAVWGTVQMMSGVLSFGLGLLFAVTQEITVSLLVLFRISLLTGSLFFIAGLLSNLLFKCPRLLPVCLSVNIGSIIVAVIGAVLIVVDFAVIDLPHEHLKMEAMALCVLVLATLVSAVVSRLIYIEKRKYSP